jgi:alpha-N-arabinofuranosidase
MAAKDAQGRLLLSLTNVDPLRPARIEVDLGDASLRTVTGETLTAPRVDSINTFESPRTVSPKPLAATIGNGRLRVTLEPKSVSVLALQR